MLFLFVLTALSTVAEDKLPVMEKELADLPKPESDPQKQQLLALLLSPASCTEKVGKSRRVFDKEMGKAGFDHFPYAGGLCRRSETACASG